LRFEVYQIINNFAKIIHHETKDAPLYRAQLLHSFDIKYQYFSSNTNAESEILLIKLLSWVTICANLVVLTIDLTL